MGMLVKMKVIAFPKGTGLSDCVGAWHWAMWRRRQMLPKANYSQIKLILECRLQEVGTAHLHELLLKLQ